METPPEYLVRRVKQDGTITLEISAATTHKLGDDMTMEIFSLELVGMARRNL